jgi:hypothetical protein
MANSSPEFWAWRSQRRKFYLNSCYNTSLPVMTSKPEWSGVLEQWWCLTTGLLSVRFNQLYYKTCAKRYQIPLLLIMSTRILVRSLDTSSAYAPWRRSQFQSMVLNSCFQLNYQDWPSLTLASMLHLPSCTEHFDAMHDFLKREGELEVRRCFCFLSIQFFFFFSWTR